MQELIEVLKTHRDTARQKEELYQDLALTEYYDGRAKAFEDAISFAEVQLEKEKKEFDEAFLDGNGSVYVGEEYSYYDKTFNTKER